MGITSQDVVGILAALVVIAAAARLARLAIRIAVDLLALYLILAVLRHPGNIQEAITAQWRELSQVLPEITRWASEAAQRLIKTWR